MRITNVDVRKFRSIEQLEFEAQPLTVLSGLNSSGKSNVLRAIRFAFVPDYSSARMAKNIPLFVTGPNAMTRVKLTFDQPTTRIEDAFSLASGKPWTYEVDVKRNGVATYKVNGTRISAADRQIILEDVLVIFVPPIRDIAGQGLEPFKKMLSDAIKKARGGRSVTAASRDLRLAIVQKGRKLLQEGRFPEIGRLSVDLSEPDIETILRNAEINVRNSHGMTTLDSFGTGHQNQVVLAFHRQLAAGAGRSVIFQFEEPDNHMHMTAMRVIADDLTECANGSQAFVTTHSPGLMNHFDLRSHVCLSLNDDSKTVRRKFTPSLSDREYRVALSQFGLRPAEAMTARRVVVVEGATDVSLVRAIYKHYFGRNPEHDDVLIAPVSGKDQAARLAALLKDLGVNWLCLFDFDAALNESRPYFANGIPPGVSAALIASIDQITPNLNSMVGRKSRTEKILESMRNELATGVRPAPGFAGSVVSNLVDRLAILPAAARTAVASAVAKRQHSKWREPLLRSGIWLWSSTPEQLLVKAPSALAAAEGVLRVYGVMAGMFPTSERLREVVIGKLHELAALPEVHEEAVSAVLGSGPVGTDQFRRFADELGA